MQISFKNTFFLKYQFNVVTLEVKKKLYFPFSHFCYYKVSELHYL